MFTLLLPKHARAEITKEVPLITQRNRDFVRKLMFKAHDSLIVRAGLMMLLHREREYVQLHRDTTPGTLTLSPTLRDGVVVYAQRIEKCHTNTFDTTSISKPYFFCQSRTILQIA